ncbi:MULTISPECIES: MFS transporter [unclassified Beijerinckia]|uniref:MFS transporter n=1 Tax=unclassified Beijerinckia TaxID=2638183 RepID=UPI000898AC26|nr:MULTISPECIES: MFS transporter [unclassified Beijerinckia]MDH7794228.1 AAHS family 4-hydroxybenzoate transporter-like MFS transporter [Beijerinckia sp. GAS462]SEB56309.1 MFS transporter, AAHS family, 4-hydroxybenzoate transporter [Beijerinckia sp. 28-YEA-48]
MTGNVRDVGEIINNTPINGFRGGIFAICFLVMMLDGFDTQAAAFVAPTLMAEWKLSPGTLGAMFSSVLLGAIIGAFLLGYISDRLGRRNILAACVAWFGIFNLATAFATTADTFVIFRFICGLGLGGAIPNVVAMVSEYAPEKRRATLISVTWAGFALGAVLGGLVSIPLISALSWHAVFVLGGLLPLILAPLILWKLPESVKFLSLSPKNNSTIAAIVRRINPQGTYSADDTYTVRNEKLSEAKISAIFQNGLALGSIFLCLALFMSLLLVYLFLNWIPLLLRASGLSLQNALLGTVIFNLAGIFGSIACSWLIDRNRKQGLIILIAVYFLGAIAVASIGLVGPTFGAIMATVFLSGFLVIGVQLSLQGVIAGYYPTAIRGTGIGWSQVVGRSGSLIGPLVGGSLVAAGFSPAQLFQISSAAPLLAALSLAIFLVFSRKADQ